MPSKEVILQLFADNENDPGKVAAALVALPDDDTTTPPEGTFTTEQVAEILAKQSEASDTKIKSLEDRVKSLAARPNPGPVVQGNGDPTARELNDEDVDAFLRIPYNAPEYEDALKMFRQRANATPISRDGISGGRAYGRELIDQLQ